MDDSASDGCSTTPHHRHTGDPVMESNLTATQTKLVTTTTIVVLIILNTSIYQYKTNSTLFSEK